MRYLLFGLFIILIGSCGVFKKAPVRSVLKAPEPPKEQKVTPPVETKEEDQKDEKSITDSLKRIPEVVPIDSSDLQPLYKIKDQYGVALFLPLMPVESIEEESEEENDDEPKDLINSWNQRFLQYAAGMRKAFEAYADSTGFNYRLYINTSGDWDGDLLEQDVLENHDRIDVMIGGVRKETLNKLTDWSLEYGKIYISPWLPQAPLLQSPFYIQLSPGRALHCKALISEILSNYSIEELTVLVDSSGQDQVDCLVQQLEDLGIEKRFHTVWVPEFSEELDLSLYFSEKDTQVVLIPEERNKGFIHGLLSRLSLIEDHSFIIYGMPTWEQYDLLYDYFEKFELYISSASNVEVDSIHLHSFQSQFVNEFGMLPGDFGLRGYDHGCFVADQLYRRGLSFTQFPKNSSHSFLKYPIRLSNEDFQTLDGQVMLPITNTMVTILKYTNHQFRNIRLESE
jgi:hypothetical protein